MNIDRNKLNALAKLPDDQFAALVYTVVTAAGGKKMQAMAASANAAKIKEKILTTSEEELNQMTDSIDPATLSVVLDIINKKEG